MALSGITIALAKESRVSVASTFARWSQFTVRHMAEPVDATNFELGQYEEGSFGTHWLEWELEGVWDLNLHPSGYLYPRDDLSNLVLYVNFTLALGYIMPLARVFPGSGPVSQVRGGVMFRGNGRSQGSFTIPPT